MFFALCSIFLSPTTLCFSFLLPCMHAGAKMAKDSLLTPNTTWNFVQKKPPHWSLHVLAVCFLQSISVFLSLFCLVFFPSRYEGHQASGDAVPQEESKRPPPSYCFFHNLLFMSDRPPSDKWLPYGERKTREREEGKTLAVSLWVSLKEIRFSFWGGGDISCVSLCRDVHSLQAVNHIHNHCLR